MHNGKYILQESKNSLFTNTTPHTLLKQYKHFLSNFGLNQIIKAPTRITCETSTLIDHILTNSHEKISQSGVIDCGLSDHNVIFCTRKINKIKTGIRK